MKSREGERVMLAASGSLQAGDPGLETGHLGLLQEDKNTSFGKDNVNKFTHTHVQRDFLRVRLRPVKLHLDKQRLVGGLHGLL